MDKLGIDNQICVKIIIRKGSSDSEVIYYRNKLPMWLVEQWRWYFDYIAALVKVRNPRRKVELTVCAQTLKQGREYIEEKSKTLLRAKNARLKKLQSIPVQDDLFGHERKKREKDIKKLRDDIEALERGEFNYYVPPTYINRLKQWIHEEEVREHHE